VAGVCFTDPGMTTSKAIGTVIRRALLAPLAPTTWRETLHLSLGAVLALPVAGYLLAVGYAVAFSVTVAGVLLLAALVRGARVIGTVERARGRALLGLDVPAPPAAERPEPGVTGWARTALTDRAGWRALLYALLAVPAGLAQGAVTVVLWVETLGALTWPMWSLLRPDPGAPAGGLFGWSDRLSNPLIVPAVGLAGVLAAPWVVRGLANLDRWRMTALLGPSQLDERVHRLERGRAQAAEHAADQLRRIERDLHDGVQARLVALAMELGQARDEIGRDGAPRPATVRVAAAHEHAKEALAELRDLARGIYPAVLTDLGLDGAVPMLTARCPIPTSADVELSRRPSAAVEATAYLCVAELLTNAAKHSQAGSASVRIRRHDDRLRVEVGDDGVGGATVIPGGGLAGLAARTESLDGRLLIASPDGGPTLITVELPCAW
jgi:signal transduction histidine kinase